LLTKSANVLIFAVLVFRDKNIQILRSENLSFDKILFYVSLILLLVYIAFLDLRLAAYILPFIFLIYLIVNRKILIKVDWALLVLFMVIFIDFGIIASFPIVSEIIKDKLTNTSDIFLMSSFLSQIISNVPASVLLSKFTHNWLAITYGVNIGGNGLLSASLANIIALRLTKNNKLWLKFHFYSIPFFILTVIVVLAYLRF